MYKLSIQDHPFCISVLVYVSHPIQANQRESLIAVLPHRESFFRVDLDHAPQQSLAVGDEMGHVEHSTLHLLQQLPQVIVVEGQRALRTASPRYKDTDGSDMQGVFQLFA